MSYGYDWLRKQKLKEKMEAERRAPKGFAKIISWIGGVIGLLIFVAYEYAEYSCSDWVVYHKGGSFCGPFRMLYDFFNW